MARQIRKRKPDPQPDFPLAAAMEQHLEALRSQNYSEYTVKNRRVHIGFFLTWADEHGLRDPLDITRPILERYQRYLFHYRQKNGQHLSFRSQHSRLVPLPVWFRWMARQRLILHIPASELELPRLGHRLPKHVLTISEAEQVLAQPDVTSALGLRDPQTDTGSGEPSLGSFDLTIHTFFDAFGDCGLHLVGCSFGFLQSPQALFPFRQLGIAQGSILDDLVALVFGVEGRNRRIGFRGAHEVVQGRIEQG